MLRYGPVERGCLYKSAMVPGDNRPELCDLRVATNSADAAVGRPESAIWLYSCT
jgi:hypothetical protein